MSLTHLLSIADKAAHIAARNNPPAYDDYRSEAYLILMKIINKKGSSDIGTEEYVKRCILNGLFRYMATDKLIPVPQATQYRHNYKLDVNVVFIEDLSSENEDDGYSNPVDMIAAPPATETVDDALTEYNIDGKQASIIYLADAGYEKHEISQLLGRSPGWLRNQMCLLRKHIKRCWKRRKIHERVRTASAIQNQEA